MKEVLINQRQVNVNQRQGVTPGSRCSTGSGLGVPEDQMAEVSACLRGRVSNLAGGPVRELNEPAWKDAPRLVSKREAQKFHNAGRLEGLIAEGAEHTILCAGSGNPQ